MFHDLALKLLFSTVNIYFGAWEATHMQSQYHPEDLVTALEDSAEGHSFDMMDKIQTDARFANVVQKIVVHAFARAGSEFHTRP